MDGVVISPGGSGSGGKTSPKRQVFTTNGVLVAFTVTDYILDALNFIEANGFVQPPSAYSVSGQVITFTDPPTPGSLVIHGYEGVNLVDFEEAIARTGTEVRFDVAAIYGSSAIPIAGDITFNFANAKLGMANQMVHNDAGAPALPAEAIVLNGSYTNAVDNYIMLQYIANGEVLVSYSQE